MFLLSDVNDSVVSSYGDIEGNSERLDPNRYQHVLVIRLPNLFLSDLSAGLMDDSFLLLFPPPRFLHYRSIIFHLSSSRFCISALGL